ncbi:hypothetical protein SLE2022_088810 [Rubroshorea leprosula]
MQHSLYQRQSGTNPPSSTEWNELKVSAFDIDFRTQECLRFKTVWHLPNAGVPAYSPCVTSTCAPSGNVNPQISASAPALRGSSRGTGGCIRRVSLMTASKYGKRTMSDSCTCFSLPIVSSNSALAVSKTLGLQSNSAIAHFNVLEVVSVSATNKLCHISYLTWNQKLTSIL